MSFLLDVDDMRFLELKNEILSSAIYFTKDIGMVRECIEFSKYPYLIFMDDKAVFIRSYTITETFDIKDMHKFDGKTDYTKYGAHFVKAKTTYGFKRWAVSLEQIESIEEYIKSYKNRKRGLIKERKAKKSLETKERTEKKLLEIEERKAKKSLETKERTEKKLLEIEERKAKKSLEIKERTEKKLLERKEKEVKRLQLKLEKEQKKRNEIQERLKLLDSLVNELIIKDEIVTMIHNFMIDILDNVFIDIQYLSFFEEKLIHEYFGLEKINREYYINDSAKEKIENQFDKIIKLFIHKKILDGNFSYKEYYIVITKVIKHISSVVYGNQFEESFIGYFNDITNMKYKDCVDTYFGIEIIDPLDRNTLSLFTYFLILHKKLAVTKKQVLYYDGFDKISKTVQKLNDNKDLFAFEKKLLKTKKPNNLNHGITLDTVDLMSGIEFENFTLELFKKMGYSTHLTKQSGDQGIDVIAAKNGHSLGIQVKCYSNTVSNKAIQEVAAGKAHYKVDKAIVLTNNYFTDSARELATSNGVILWDRNILKDKIRDYFSV